MGGRTQNLKAPPPKSCGGRGRLSLRSLVSSTDILGDLGAADNAALSSGFKFCMRGSKRGSGPFSRHHYTPICARLPQPEQQARIFDAVFASAVPCYVQKIALSPIIATIIGNQPGIDNLRKRRGEF